MDGTKEYIRELKDYIEYLKDTILDLYDALEDDIFLSEDRLEEIARTYDEIIRERKEKENVFKK